MIRVLALFITFLIFQSANTVVTESIDEERMLIEREVEKYAEEYDIPAELILAMVETESTFNPEATSTSGCIGLMQIDPRWHEDRMDKYAVEDLYDISDNLRIGCDYMAELLDKYDVKTALMVYNEGWNGAARSKQGITSGYAKKIMARAEQIRKGR